MRNEMMNLVTETIREIDKTYRPGTLEWLKKNRPMEWKALVWLETWINERVQKGQDRELRELLNEYKELLIKANKLG
jgi:hypothetical protein